ncbi:MAG: UDP-N-acetylglucosamine 2-epimerase [Methanoregula sp. SKADARSKE-2]|nr:MAG: UDP-N-acetylglucosamine 2-epimerase [Methanoregula sp. SKADARSKE-2]
MITIVLGTRPEIIKMAPVIRACRRAGAEYSILHTGQHYSYEMDRVFFEELELPAPDHNLDVGSGSHAVQTGRIMAGIEKVLAEDGSDIVLVQGDTNTVLAGALTAAKLHIPIGHVEAGLRSFDRRMPEEINRLVADHLAEYLFAPTTLAEGNLLAEGIGREKIFVSGNTVVDAVFENWGIAKKRTGLLRTSSLLPQDYFLVTAHRAENVDVKARLKELIVGLNRLHELYSVPVIFPMHPRTQKMMKEFGIAPGGIAITDPVGYLEFLELEGNARLVLTDSGGVQEEACILNVPCVTLRENTERPETVDVGGNLLAGTSADRIVAAAEKMLLVARDWKNPYGDGKAGERIVGICKDTIRKTRRE